KWMKESLRKIPLRGTDGDHFSELREFNHDCRAELAEKVGDAINAYLSTKKADSYDEMKMLAMEVNTLLRDFGLAIQYDGRPCLLRAATNDGRGMLRLETQD